MYRPQLSVGPVVGAIAVALTASAPAGFTLSTVLLQGDFVGGFGAVTTIESIDVSSAGDWLIEVDTDAPVEGDRAVFRNGVLLVRESDTLPFPLAGTVSSFDSVRLSTDGNVGWNLFLNGLPSNLDSGVFNVTTPLIQEGALAGAPEFSPGTPYIGFFEAHRNGSGDFMVVASVDDPNIATTVDRALVRLTVVEGNPAPTQSVLAKEGDVLPGQTETVADFGTDGESSSFNDAGDFLYTVDVSGDTTVDTALYLNLTMLAREGSASSVTGRNYTSIVSAKVDLSHDGDWVMRTGLDGDAATNSVIVLNGATFIQKGDPAPGLPGRTITGFGTGPINVTDDGEVVWYAALDGDLATNQALYKGTTLLVQKGVTAIDGAVISTIGGSTATGGITKGFSASPNGQYVIFRGVLETGAKGAFLVDFGDAGNPCDLDGDSIVDGSDLGILLSNWGMAGIGDLDNSGTVDGADLGELLACWS